MDYEIYIYECKMYKNVFKNIHMNNNNNNKKLLYIFKIYKKKIIIYI